MIKRTERRDPIILLAPSPRKRTPSTRLGTRRSRRKAAASGGEGDGTARHGKVPTTTDCRQGEASKIAYCYVPPSSCRTGGRRNPERSRSPLVFLRDADGAAGQRRIQVDRDDFSNRGGERSGPTPLALFSCVRVVTERSAIAILTAVHFNSTL